MLVDIPIRIHQIRFQPKKKLNLNNDTGIFQLEWYPMLFLSKDTREKVENTENGDKVKLTSIFNLH